jgi:hypothetical protein
MEREKIEGVMLLPVTLRQAKHVVEEFAPLALQLGPYLSAMYESFVEAIDNVESGNIPDNGEVSYTRIRSEK